MVNTLSALADPNRLRIVELLLGGESSVNELVARLKLNQPHVSKQLKVLRDAGVVTVTQQGQRRVYGLKPEPMRELHEYLERYRRLWEARFDAMDEVVEQLKQEEQTHDRSKKDGSREA